MPRLPTSFTLLVVLGLMVACGEGEDQAAEVDRLEERLEEAEERADEAEEHAARLQEELDALTVEDDSEPEFDPEGRVPLGEAAVVDRWEVQIAGAPVCESGPYTFDRGFEPGTYEPQGQFCRVAAQVEHVGNNADQLHAQRWEVADDLGRTHGADQDVSISWTAEAGTEVAPELNPGQTAEVVPVFDTPADNRPTALVLIDDSFQETARLELDDPVWEGEGDAGWLD